jgi:hypothetical protein
MLKQETSDRIKIENFLISSLSQGHYSIRDLKMEETEITKSFGVGQFKAVVESNTIENGATVHVMSYNFFFHTERA